MKNFLSSQDVQDLSKLLATAKSIKQQPFANKSLGHNKTMVLLFFNPSLRTRLSTQKAALNLGMEVIPMNVSQGWGIEFEDGTTMNLDKAEHVREAAAVISQYADVIGIRSFPTLKNREQDYQDLVLSQFAKYATVPIVNLESSIVHPLQSLTDLFTIEERKKVERPKVVLTWAPHPRVLPQAVSNSFLEWMALANCDVTLTHPKGYELAEQYTQNCKIEYDQQKAFEGADFVYAKNWSSYTDYGKILSEDPAWMVNEVKMKVTNEAFFMHCLPVRRNVVVSDAVIDSPQSIVIEQAANRQVTAQAVLTTILQSVNS